MDLNVLCKKPRTSGGKSAPIAGPESAQPEVEVIHMEASAKRPVGNPVTDQATAGRPDKRVKIAVRKHKSQRDEGSSRRATREREPEVSTEDSSLTYCRPKLMKDLCGMRVREDDKDYYVLQMAEWAPKDSSAAMRARWLNLSYQTRAWDDPEAAWTAKQIALGHHYQMALLDRVHDLGHLVTHMGNRSSLLEAELEKLKTERDPEQLTLARQRVDELQADNAKLRFGWGLGLMGQVSYEYGYRVALAHFQARYPDLEVDSDPFTEQPEDSSIPMETRQEFDDSGPPTPHLLLEE
ncbi:hypothetical protein BHM03_00051728 [Ensete ventricosum]|nr:hypothetical protein BHM03_00051728 [Ensete ventricosum]